ncbi:MAG: hypothetical protein VX777_10745 [Chlamydiota bacterium]|nr:hypothetical protein [Chlamydiota bacterium]
MNSSIDTSKLIPVLPGMTSEVTTDLLKNQKLRMHKTDSKISSTVQPRINTDLKTEKPEVETGFDVAKTAHSVKQSAAELLKTPSFTNRPLPKIPEGVEPFDTKKRVQKKLRPLPKIPEGVEPFDTKKKNNALPIEDGSLKEVVVGESERKTSGWKAFTTKIKTIVVAFFRGIKTVFEKTFGRLFGRVKRIKIGKKAVVFENGEAKKIKGPVVSEEKITLPMSENHTKFFKDVANIGNGILVTEPDGSEIVIPPPPNYPAPKPPTKEKVTAPVWDGDTYTLSEDGKTGAGIVVTQPDGSETVIPPPPNYPAPKPPTRQNGESSGNNTIPTPPPLPPSGKITPKKWIMTKNDEETKTSVVKDAVNKKKERLDNSIHNLLFEGLKSLRAKTHLDDYETDDDDFLSIDFEDDINNTETTLSFGDNKVDVTQRKRASNYHPLAKKADLTKPVETLSAGLLSEAVSHLKHFVSPEVKEEKKEETENIFAVFSRAFESMNI